MQATSALYNELLAKDHWKETRLAINDAEPEEGYDESDLISMRTFGQVFASENPVVGGCVSRTISIQMKQPRRDIPRQAKLIPWVRLTDGTQASEWIQKGVFYIDTRKKTEDGSDFEILNIEGYDDILRAEQYYPETALSWPAIDIDVVNEIADFIGVSVDPRTVEVMTNSYQVGYPEDYTCRETLGYIAAMYGGCFIMSDIGQLLLVTLGSVFADDDQTTHYLINEEEYRITVGGVRILV